MREPDDADFTTEKPIVSKRTPFQPHGAELKYAELCNGLSCRRRLWCHPGTHRPRRRFQPSDTSPCQDMRLIKSLGQGCLVAAQVSLQADVGKGQPLPVWSCRQHQETPPGSERKDATPLRTPLVRHTCRILGERFCRLTEITRWQKSVLFLFPLHLLAACMGHLIVSITSKLCEATQTAAPPGSTPDVRPKAAPQPWNAPPGLLGAGQHLRGSESRQAAPARRQPPGPATPWRRKMPTLAYIRNTTVLLKCC